MIPNRTLTESIKGLSTPMSFSYTDVDQAQWMGTEARGLPGMAEHRLIPMSLEITEYLTWRRNDGKEAYRKAQSACTM